MTAKNGTIDKEIALRLMMLLSALESWSFTDKGKFAPDYLLEEIDALQEFLRKVVLE